MKYIPLILIIFILFLNLNLAYANINSAQAIWELKNFEKQNTNTLTTGEWNEQYYNSPTILYGNLQYGIADKNNINNFEPITTTIIGTSIAYKAIESLIETGVEYGIAELTDDQQFNPWLSFGKNMAVNSTIGLIPGTSEAKIGTKTAIYFGKLTLRTAGDTAVDKIARDGDTQDYILPNLLGNIVGDSFPVLVKKYFSKTAIADEVVEGVVKYGDRAVIGKINDLQPKNLKIGENTLLKHLPNQGNPKANWIQNSSVLRQEMRKGQPIRDASVHPNGELIDDTGFLKAERNLLMNQGWTYNPVTHLWSPPK